MSKSVVTFAGAVLSAAFLFSCLAQADEKAQAKVQTAAEEDKLICKRLEETGTRLRKHKVCRTESEWEAQAKAAQEFAKSNERRSGTQGRGIPGAGGS